MTELKYECDLLWVFSWKVHTDKSWHDFDWRTAISVAVADSSWSSPVPCCHTSDENKAKPASLFLQQSAMHEGI